MSISTYKVTKKSAHIQVFSLDMCRLNYGLSLYRDFFSALYYIDLVFYNYILKCFVLIDLKTSKITHQDVGQMDMYVRMYDERQRSEGDNPTIGLLLCEDTDEDIARYSILHDNAHLFASKYMTYMPTREQLKAEIERQKTMFLLKHDGSMEDE